MVVMSYYHSRDFPFISGISGETNKWLMNHSEEIVNNQENDLEIARSRAVNMYDRRFANLGFQQENGIWKFSNNGEFCELFRRALTPKKLGQGEIVKVRCPQGRVKKVTLPKFGSLVTERGLGKLIDHFRDLVYFPEVDQETFLKIMEILRSIRNMEKDNEVQKDAMIFDHKYPFWPKR